MLTHYKVTQGQILAEYILLDVWFIDMIKKHRAKEQRLPTDYLTKSDLADQTDVLQTLRDFQMSVGPSINQTNITKRLFQYAL